MRIKLHQDHSHSYPSHPGFFANRTQELYIDKNRKRPLTIGIGGPVGSGKTALVKALCESLRSIWSLAVVTNDIYTKEDAEFLLRHQALDANRILGVETGGCPHAAIREDITMNLAALDELTEKFSPTLDVLLVESGGDNLSAHFSKELVDFSIYVIDVAGGDKIPRKGGPGITQSDLLVINKTDLALAVGASLDVMDHDAKMMRQDGPFCFTSIVKGEGLDRIIYFIEKWKSEFAIAKAENC